MATKSLPDCYPECFAVVSPLFFCVKKIKGGRYNTNIHHLDMFFFVSGEGSYTNFHFLEMFFCNKNRGEGRYTNIHPLEMMMSASVFSHWHRISFVYEKYEAFA